MSVTKRFVLLLLVCAVIVLAVGFFSGMASAIIFILANIIIAVLFIMDIVTTPKPEALSATRSTEVKLSLAGEHDVIITVRNDSDRELFAEVTDDVPEHFTYSMPIPGEWIPAHTEKSYTYKLKPLKRGEFHFPRITVRYTGVYGLCRKQRYCLTDDCYKVYPNMKDLSKYRMAALSKNLFVQGVRRVRTMNSGGEFDSLRDYTQGDPFHNINWSATARRNLLTVNSYVPERNQYIYVMIDSSRVMNAEFNNIKMLDYSINAAFLLADHCISGGDNIGMVVFDNKVRRFLKPHKGPAQFSAMAEQLYNVEHTESAADYDTAIQFLAQKQRRRSLVFVFTELFNVDEAVRFAAAVREHLSNHIVYAITIKDPRIEEQASSDGSTTDDMYLKSAAVKLVQDRKAIVSVLNANGIMNSDVEPDKLSLAAVSTYLNIKRSGAL